MINRRLTVGNSNTIAIIITITVLITTIICYQQTSPLSNWIRTWNLTVNLSFCHHRITDSAATKTPSTRRFNSYHDHPEKTSSSSWPTIDKALMATSSDIQPRCWQMMKSMETGDSSCHSIWSTTLCKYTKLSPKTQVDVAMFS